MHDVSIALVYVNYVREVLHVKFPANEELIGTVDVRQCRYVFFI